MVVQLFNSMEKSNLILIIVQVVIPLFVVIAEIGMTIYDKHKVSSKGCAELLQLSLPSRQEQSDPNKLFHFLRCLLHFFMSFTFI